MLLESPAGARSEISWCPPSIPARLQSQVCARERARQAQLVLSSSFGRGLKRKRGGTITRFNGRSSPGLGFGASRDEGAVFPGSPQDWDLPAQGWWEWGENQAQLPGRRAKLLGSGWERGWMDYPALPDPPIPAFPCPAYPGCRAEITLGWKQQGQVEGCPHRGPWWALINGGGSGRENPRNAAEHAERPEEF